MSQVSMMTKNINLLFIPFLLIGGCSSGDDEATQPNKEHIYNDQTQVLEKAKSVEQVLQTEADKQRQAIEEQSDQ